MTSADVPTVRDRLIAAGLTAERIEEHLRAGRISLDGDPVVGLDQPAPPGSRLVLVAR